MKNMKRALFLLTVLCVSLSAYGQKSYELSSPDGNILVSVRVSDNIYYDITSGDKTLLDGGVLQMQIGEQVLGAAPKVTGTSTRTVRESISPVVPFKFSNIENHYNQLLLKFRGDYSVEFRAFDDGVAYRFITNKKGEVEVMNEVFQVDFPEDYLVHVQLAGRFKTAYEESYRHLKFSEWKEAKEYTLLPLLVETEDSYKILISESALTDYPAMFLTGAGGNDGLSSTFPKNPVEFGPDGDRSVKLVKEADYIAKTSGMRSFPWRYFVITKEDGKLIENTMTARLAEPNLISDPSWIKPGVTTWEWWNGATPYGPEVDFTAGCNTETYKYFIDFASKFGIEYILLDEGWAINTRDPYTPNKDLDLQELIRYGKQKNVDIILWLTWLVVENNFDLFEKYAEWGVKGVKIDFMDRSDQWMVNYYERVAAEAAKHKLFVDFHGSFKPAGLEYKYPNILSYEGVRGMEQMGGCRPDNSVFFPFLRNAVGPMDYTPGAMLNYQPNTLRADRPNSGSIGTRAYQMALFVLFETGLQMMADNPTLYYQNEDCARFMANVPVVTDETVSMAAKVGEYAIVAKRKGDKWYIGGMTNNDEGERVFTLPLDFLEEGKTYRMTSYEDGSNANRQAMHYVKNVKDVKKGRNIRVKMARNGGFAAVIE
jgi:alpha-glucosidase